MPEDPQPLAARWARRNLTPEQIVLARELTARADRLWVEAAGELSLAEAVTIAAIQLGHFPDGGAS